MPQLHGLLDQRMSWMANHNIALSGEPSRLMALVRRPSPDADMLAVGMWDSDTLVAAFALHDAVPNTGWTLAEREQPSLLLSLAHTLPDQQGLGPLLGRWVCDYAARRPNPPTWVRCAARAPGLADYLEKSGWFKVREVVSVVHGASYLFQRAPQQDDILGSLVRGGLVSC
ncbi:hypothetical protein [Streptomyces sp. NPDC004050]